VTRNPLAVDAAIAVLIAALVLILAPGLAVVALLVLIVLVACGVGLLRRALRSRRPPRRRNAPRHGR
jgi:predicted membrane metal-binding protein